MRPPALTRGPRMKPSAVGVGGPVSPGDVGERGEAGAGRARHDLEALAHQGAVQAGQRRHVGDGGERDQVEHAEQVGPGGALGRASGG